MGRLVRITPKKPSKGTLELGVEDSTSQLALPVASASKLHDAPSNRKRKRPPPSPGNDSFSDDNSDPGSDYIEESSKKGSSTPKRAKVLPRKSSNSPKKSTKGSSPSKPSKPPATDPSTWRESRIPAEETIIKGDAVKLYRLDAKTDFEGLICEKTPSNAGYLMFIYRERDVERRAWEKHGSPEGFDFYLSKLKERHNKSISNSPQKQIAPFVEPQRRVDKFEAAANKRRRELASLQKEFPPWLWDALIAYLDSLEDEMSALATYLQYINPRLEKLRVAKKQNIQSDYPHRPSDPPPSESDSFTALEELLSEAPSTSMDGFDWDDPPDGMLTHRDGWTGDCSAEWDQEFNDQVNNAVADVVTELGGHYKQHALWMVYDAYVQCIGGLGSVEAERNWDPYWFDDALKVFKGPLESILG